MLMSEWLTLPLCLFLGGVFLVAALPKLLRPGAFTLAVLEYHILPLPLARLYAALVPPGELLLALLLLCGAAVQFAAAALTALLLSFLMAVIVNLRRGRDLECHCFGARQERRIGLGLVWQDSGLLAVSLSISALAGRWWTPEPWSLFARFGLTDASTLAPILACLCTTVGTSLVLSLAPAWSLARYHSVRYNVAPLLVGGRRAAATLLRLSAHGPLAPVRAAALAATAPSSVAAMSPELSPELPATALPLAMEGPPLGSPLPTLPLLGVAREQGCTQPHTNRTRPSLTLLVCLSALCPTCQNLVEPLNALVLKHTFCGEIIVVLRADEVACRRFLSVFPLRMQVVCDADGAVTRTLGVHTFPIALLYGSERVLLRARKLQHAGELQPLLAVEYPA